MSGAVYLWTCTDRDEAWARETGIAGVSATYGQDFTSFAGGYLVLGTPEQAVSRLREFAADGAERVLIALTCPSSDRARVLRTLADEVVAQLRHGV